MPPEQPEPVQQHTELSSPPGEQAETTAPSARSAHPMSPEESGAAPAEPAPPNTHPAQHEEADPPPLGEPRSLDPAFLTAERLSGAITCAVLFLGILTLLALDLIFGWWSNPARTALYSALAFAWGLIAWASIIWPRYEIRATLYRTGPGGIEIHRGVFWKRVLNVPRSRIQHSDVTQGPMLRKFGLASLTVHTAASKTPSVSLTGLRRQDALAIRDLLTNASEGDGV